MTVSYRNADATVSAYKAEAVTTSDTETIPVTRAIYVGGFGDVKVDMAMGGTVTFPGVLAGTILPIQVTRVYSTGTSATNMVALF